MSRFEREFGPVYRAVREDIFKFCTLLNFAPTWQQAEALELVMNRHKRIAIKSGQGPGKSAVSVIVALWRTIRFKDALTIVTAPTMRQAKRWVSECERLLNECDPTFRAFFEVTKQQIRLAGRTNWGIDLVTANRPECAAGYHEDNMTIVVDEASGITPAIWETFEGTLTNENALMFVIGNPNTRSCPFFDCFNRFRHRWATLTLNTEDTSRITLYNRSGKETKLVDPENINYMAEKYGADSDVYRVRIKGEFPFMDPNSIVSAEVLEYCTQEKLFESALRERRANGKPAKQFGLDFARFGSDESVIYRRSGNAIVDWSVFVKQEPIKAVHAAFRMQSEAYWRDKDCWYVADAGGMGQGVMHAFRDANKNILEFHNGSRPSRDDYDNKITEAFFHFAELAKNGKVYIPNDNRLISQIASRQYYMTKKGKIIVESKDEFIKRGETEDGSPDRADALMLCYYDAVEADGRFVGVAA